MAVVSLIATSSALAGPFAYVTNYQSHNVSVVDTATNTVTAVVPVGSSPGGVAITPNGAFAYVANQGSNSVSVIATATNTVIATVPSVGSPNWLAITPNGAFVYVANQGSGTVSVIATATNTVIATIPVGSFPLGVAITPNGAFAYVVNFSSNTVSVIDTATNTVSATVPGLGGGPIGMAITPNGAFAYVSNHSSGTVSVIATATNVVTATVPAPGSPYVVAITPNGAFAYVAKRNGSVSVIDTATNGVTATVAVGSDAIGVAFTPDGAFAYVTDFSSNSVSVIDTATNTVATTVAVGISPVGVAITPPIPNPIAYYPLNGDGAEATNNNVNLGPIGTPTYVAAMAPGLGQALSVNGIDQALIGAGFTPSTTGAITLSAWARANTLASTGSIFKNWPGQFHFGLDGAIGALSNYINLTGIGGQPLVTASTPLPVSQWTHVAVVVNSATHQQRLFMNGVLVATAPFSGTLRNNPCPGLGIGVKTNCAGTNADIGNVPGFWHGQIDEVAAWDVALTDSQIGSVYERGLSGTPLIEVQSGDLTPPQIDVDTTGTVGTNGWFTSDVAVAWTVTDAESPISSTDGCDATSVTADTSSVTFTCTATSGGGPATESVTIKRDATAPSATASALPMPNGDGWNNSDVTVQFSGTDVTSGIANCSPDAFVTSEGIDQSSSSGTCTDNAGNVSGAVVASNISIDWTAPLVSGVALPLPGVSGWSTTAVTVVFTGLDGLAGVSAGGCVAPVLVTSDGQNQSVPGHCADRAGNIGSAIVTGISLDTIAPIAVASRSPAANANSWNNTNVTVSFGGTDSMSGSGVAACSADVVLTAEAANQSATGTCQDVATNTSDVASITNINIDKTVPSVVVLTPVPNDGFVIGETPKANYNCTDALSGNADCSGPVPNTAAIDTSSLGTRPFTVAAVDRAGNMASASLNYTVNPPGTTIITLIAGTGIGPGFGGDGGAAISAKLLRPTGVAVDVLGNVYVAERHNNRVRKISPSGIITTFAGNGNAGYAGDSGLAKDASLYEPMGIAVDAAGNLYIADSRNQRIRSVSANTGMISTVAGNGGFGFNGDGGPATGATLAFPSGVAVDTVGNLYIADSFNYRVRKVSGNGTGIISTVAGTGAYGFGADGVTAVGTSLGHPIGVSIDTAGNLYFAEQNEGNDRNSRVRKVTPSGNISTVAGIGVAAFGGDGGPATSAFINQPSDVVVDQSGYLYIADQRNSRVRIVTPGGTISTFAGNGTGAGDPGGDGGDGGPASLATIGLPSGIAVGSKGDVYVTSTNANTVRRIRDTTYTLAPSAHFGSQALNTPSTARVVTLTNRGVEPVGVTSITFSGTDSNQFSQTNNCGIQTQTAVGTACNINVFFRPTAPGAKSAILNVSTAGGLGTKSVSLTGTGGATYVLDPYGLAFGNVAVGLASAAQLVSVINTGTLPLAISSISLNGTNGNQFVQTTNDCGASLAAGDACTVNVVFRPTMVGAKTANLNVNAGSGAGTKSASLTGTGTPPTYTLTPSSLAFTDQAVSVLSEERKVTLTNTGMVPVPITSVTDAGTNADQFTETHGCGTSVPVGKSCTIMVTFRPTTAGAKVATLNVTAGSGAGTKSVALSGTGVIPTFSVSPTSIAFGNQLRKTISAAQTVTVLNTSTVQLSIATTTLTGTTPNQFARTNGCSAPVMAGGTCTISVFFQPSAAGTKSATLNVNAAGGAGTKTVSLTGTGT